MAGNSISQVTSFINDNSTMEICLTAEGQPAVRSDIVAYHFHRNHKNVLRDIAKLRSKCPESFYRLNFEPVEYTDAKGEKRPAYLLTRDGFTLLVMGFTGAEAVRWKLRYIAAFNALEAAVAEDRASLAREAGYSQGLDEGRAATLPEVKAAEEKAQRETAQLFWRLGPKDKRRIRSVARYRNMGLGINSIAKLLDIGKREAFHLLRAAEVMGLLPNRPARPVQGSLLEVEA